MRVILTHLVSYPVYPFAWLLYLTKDENIAREKRAGSLIDPLDAIVSDAADPVTAVTPSGVLPASDYPAAYTSILALDAETTISTTTSATASELGPSQVQSPVASATPSDAIIIYRRDVCEQARGGEECSSFAREYNITPGQSVDTCTLEADYTQGFDKYLAGDTKDYLINIGPFTSHGLTACNYAGTNDQVGALVCGYFAQLCSVPTSTEAVTCGVATDTPIVYAEW